MSKHDDVTKCISKYAIMRFVITALNVIIIGTIQTTSGAQWLSGGVLDSGPRSRGFLTALWSLSKTHLS